MKTTEDALKRLQALRELIGVLDNNKLDYPSNGETNICNLEFVKQEKLGEGAYGIVFKGCFSQICTFPVAMKIVFFNKNFSVNQNELLALKNIAYLIEKGKVSPGFLLIGDGKLCNLKDQSKISTFALSITKNDMSTYHDTFLLLVTELLEEFVPSAIDPEHIYGVCQQLISSVCSLYQYYPQLIHYDLKGDNLLIRRININKPLLVSIFDYVYSIPNYGYIVVISDFGSVDASIYSLHEELYKGDNDWAIDETNLGSNDYFQTYPPMISFVKPALLKITEATSYQNYSNNVKYVKYGNIISILTIIRYIFENLYSQYDRKTKLLMDFINTHISRSIFRLDFDTVINQDLKGLITPNYELFHPRCIMIKFFSDRRVKLDRSDISTWPSEPLHEIDHIHLKWINDLNDSKLKSLIQSYIGSSSFFKRGTINQDELSNLIRQAPSLLPQHKPLTLYSMNKYYQNRDPPKPGDSIFYPRLLSTTGSSEFIKTAYRGFLNLPLHEDEEGYEYSYKHSYETLDKNLDKIMGAKSFNDILSIVLSLRLELVNNEYLKKEIDEMNEKNLTDQVKLKKLRLILIDDLRKNRAKMLKLREEYNRSVSSVKCCIFIIENVKNNFLSVRLLSIIKYEEEFILSPQRFIVKDSGITKLEDGNRLHYIVLNQS